MIAPDRWRERAIHGVKVYLEKRGAPRVTLGLILVLTGAAGFGISAGLLNLGMTDMWARYPLAVVGAYLIFLLLMRGWVEIERRSFNADDPDFQAALEKDAPRPTYWAPPSDGNSGLGWLEEISGFGTGAGCLPMLFIGIFLGLIGLLCSVLFGASALIAEVLLDILLVGILYRRLKIAAHDHWLGTCLRKTWLYVLSTAALLSFAGFCLALAVPEAKTMGPALKQIFLPERQ